MFQPPRFAVQILLEIPCEFFVVDADFLHQPFDFGRKRAFGRIQIFAAAVGNQRFAVHREFVALGVPAEIVVVVHNQDFGLRTRFAVGIGRGQAADAGADHHQIVAFARLLGHGDFAAAQGDAVRCGTGTVVVTAQAGERRRIQRGGGGNLGGARGGNQAVAAQSGCAGQYGGGA